MASVFVYYKGRERAHEMLRDSSDYAEGCFRLFKNDVVVGELTRAVDLVEADYSGYSPLPAGFGPMVRDNDNRAVAEMTPVTFQPQGTSVANVIYGWMFTNDSGDVLLHAERFAQPRSMANLGDQITLAPRFLVGKLAPP